MNSAPASTASSSDQPDQAEQMPIADLNEPVISNYFQTLNAGEFQATAALFAKDGALQPPFETAIVGAAAIVAYLEAEARGLMLQPQRVTVHTLADGCTEYQVGGRVKTPLFSVNVGWRLVLSPQKQICLARVKLLASLEELFKLPR